MEKWHIAAGALVLLIAMAAVLTRSTKTDEPTEGCDCQRIRDLYGVDVDRQALYWELVNRIQNGDGGDEVAERQLCQLAGPLRRDRACFVARGDVELKVAFCSVWPGVETKAREQGW